MKTALAPAQEPEWVLASAPALEQVQGRGPEQAPEQAPEQGRLPQGRARARTRVR